MTKPDSSFTSLATALREPLIRAHLSPPVAAVLPLIHVFPSLPSTNEWLLQQQDACSQVCLAEEQTAGRGRRGRVWQSPDSGNIYLSLRWCFEQVPEHYGWLGLVTGVAVAEALASYGLHGHGVKWPNDLHHQGRKLGGILLQTATPLQQVVIGIGINTAMTTTEAAKIDQPWCDLAHLLGEKVDRNRLVAVILESLVPALQAFPVFDVAQFQEEWQAWDLLAGLPVQVNAGTDVLQGIARGLDAQGQLQIELADGKRRVFSSADVSVRPHFDNTFN